MVQLPDLFMVLHSSRHQCTHTCTYVRTTRRTKCIQREKMKEAPSEVRSRDGHVQVVRRISGRIT